MINEKMALAKEKFIRLAIFQIKFYTYNVN